MTLSPRSGSAESSDRVGSDDTADGQLCKGPLLTACRVAMIDAGSGPAALGGVGPPVADPRPAKYSPRIVVRGMDFQGFPKK